MTEICSYSDPPFEEFTNDHIFPEFLGGRRSIRICRDCNSRFGHSFEAKTAPQLKRLQVFISHFGLDLTRSSASWPCALEIDGTMYDLKSGPSGVQYELARPVIRRDQKENVIGGRMRSRSEAERLAARLIRKGKVKRIEIEQFPDEILNDVKLGVQSSYNDDLYRFATKLASNVAIFMGRHAVMKASSIAKDLHGDAG